MDNLWQDPEILAVTLLTIKVSGTATLISIILGVPLGLWLALNEFPGKKLFVSVVNFGMGLPPVVVGLVVSLMLWRYGPLGMLGILTTATVMEVGKGNYDTALALSAILLLVAYSIVAALTYLQNRAAK